MQKRAVHREQFQPDNSSLPTPELQDEAKTPGTRAVAAEEAAMLMEAMKQLPQEYRDVIQFRNWDQLSFEDIGNRMGRSPEAVRKLWGRAIKRLQAIIEE